MAGGVRARADARAARRARRAAARLPGDPRRRHERQDVDDADVRRAPARRRAARRRVRLAARSRLGGADPGRRRATPTSSAPSPASGPHAAGATQFEVLTAAAFAEFAARGGRRRRRRGRARRPARRDERARRARRRAHQRRARAHRRPRRRPARRSPPRSSRSSRPARRSSSASRNGKLRPARTAPRGSTCPARTSPSRSPPPRRSSAGGSIRMRPSRARARAARAPRRAPLEIWDGAHNLAGVGYLLPRLPRAGFTIVASILADKDVDAMLARPRRRRRHARRDRTRRTRARCRADELAERRRAAFRRVEVDRRPAATRSPARATLAGPDGAVLVTGSLYLLAELSVAEA